MPDSENKALPWADLPEFRSRHRKNNPIPALDSVVKELAGRRQWLMWKYEPGETPEKKPRKMPYYASGRKRWFPKGKEQGCPEDRSALSDYASASASALKRGFDGVGFAFLPDDGLIGIDLDGMIDPVSGEISERCSEIINACNSYTEYSPSGKGVHIICTGKTDTFKSNAVGIEVFSGRQYFTFTGRLWEGAPATINELSPKTLKRLQKTVDSAKAGASKTRAPESPPAKGASLGGRQRSVAETVALAEEAIAHISPDEYQQWIDIGMACKEGLGFAGYFVWDAWSAKSTKYAGQEDTHKRWEGFKPTKITLGTLFGTAESSGWISPWEKAKTRKRNPSSTASSTRKKQEVPPNSGGVDEGSPPYKAPAGGGDSSSPPPDIDWERDLIFRKGETSSCLANAELILSHMREWRGVIGFDEFSERTVFRRKLPGDPDGSQSGEWSDHLDVTTAIWLQRKWGVEFSPTTVAQAVEVLARKHRFHPVREALAALPPWDETRRNSEWLSDYLGVERTAYTGLVGSFFLRGMIKRVMEPGCKFDYCLVLEGDQGRGKSTVARILSWHWFCDTDLDLSNKDSLLALPGHWVYEIAELGSLMKAEERKQKSFLSRQEDEFRPPYGQRLIKVPRQNVFIGTTNEEEYLKDATGGRRFWPVMCGNSFNLDGLRDNLGQMFAEALVDYYAGERCWPSADEQMELFNPEQAKRGMPEPYEELLYRWVELQVTPFSMSDAAIEGLKLTIDKLTPAITTRIGIALKKIGCGRVEDRGAKDPGKRRMYLSPSLKKIDLRSPASRTEGAGGTRAPF